MLHSFCFNSSHETLPFLPSVMNCNLYADFPTLSRKKPFLFSLTCFLVFYNSNKKGNINSLDTLQSTLKADLLWIPYGIYFWVLAQLSGPIWISSTSTSEFSATGSIFLASWEFPLLQMLSIDYCRRGRHQWLLLEGPLRCKK